VAEFGQRRTWESRSILLTKLLNNAEKKISEKKEMREKEFYSKVCVAASLVFVVDEARDEKINLSANDKFSCNIATILARDKEVVAVKLIVQAEGCLIIISKNGKWSEEDNTYTQKNREIPEGYS
jgi:hypothetical protein